MPTLDELRKTRLDKLQKLNGLGVAGYPAETVVRVSIAMAKSMEEKEVTIAGRIMAIRGHGKIFFMDVRDTTERMQIVCKADVMDQASLSLIELLDMGDFVKVAGTVGKTQAGEVSVFATTISLLSKSIRPLPNEWHGLTDVEERYRQRYVDLAINPEVKKVFETRSKVISYLRNYLDKEGFIEVETPVLQPLYGGASAKPFVTHHNALDVDLYLRIAVELYLKRLIVGGFEKVYEIGKDFRNEGMSRQHNPEFTMLEFYWAYATYEDLMQYTEIMLSSLVKELKGTMEITYQGQKLDFTPPWPRISYRDAVLKYTGIDIAVADTEKKLLSAIKEKNLNVDVTGAIGYGAILDTMYKATVRPQLIGPMYLTKRPTAFVALAKRLPEDPRFTASFQLLVMGEELLNAYNELNDPQDQAARWRESEELGKRGQEEFESFDEDYIRALEYGMPPTAGWGMGIDRLLTILEDQKSIKDVILFPTLRPETASVVHQSVVSKKVHSGKEIVQDIGIDRTSAQALLEEHIKDPITRMHCRESEVIMQAVAKRLGYDEVTWGIIGLLHDIDWEHTKLETTKHGVFATNILKKAGGSEFLIETIQSHVYGEGWSGAFYGPPEFKEKKRVTVIQHALAASETLTGLIIACAMVQPDKKLASVKLESLKKKFATIKFAAGCNREIIKECESIGIPIDEFLELGLVAVQQISGELGL